MNNRKSGGTGLAILLTVGIMLLIGFCINGSKPKCAMGGCNKERTTDSQYCVLHDLSYRSYGNPDYNAVYKQSQEKRKNNTSNTVSDTGIKNNSNSQPSIMPTKRHIQGRVLIRMMQKNMTIQMISQMNGQKNLETVIMMMDMMMHTITGKMKWNKNRTSKFNGTFLQSYIG